MVLIRNNNNYYVTKLIKKLINVIKKQRNVKNLKIQFIQFCED